MRRALSMFLALLIASAVSGCMRGSGEEATGHTLTIRNDRAEAATIQISVIVDGETILEESFDVDGGADVSRGIGGHTGRFDVQASTTGATLQGAVILMNLGGTIHVSLDGDIFQLSGTDGPRNG